MFNSKFGAFDGPSWEALCQQVFKRKYLLDDYQPFPASPGDYGLEGATLRSYLLALYQTSANKNFEGNHPGLLILDEPGQHSMRVESQHALIQHLAGESGLQSIVAASFDESDTVFKEATAGVKYQLIRWDGKLIQPLSTDN